jgi:2-methylcitrate dehydratase PrpD
VDFVTGLRFEDLPADVVHIARRCIIDGLGVMIAGSTTTGSAILRAQIAESSAVPESTVFAPTPFRTTAALAALANGTSGHALDWDDSQLSTTPDRVYGLMTHPTVPALAASLALGERLQVSGKRLLEAFVAGFEVECKIAEAIHPEHYVGGFHSSGTIGTFGAAVSAAVLLGLDRAALYHTLGIAASMASGIRVNFGTMTKPLHVGRAAQNGVVAAELAAKGFTSGADALDGKWGFFQVLGGGLDAERIVDSLGQPYTIVDPGVSIKPYPCGVVGHQTMDAMLRLVTEHDVQPAQIKQIRLRAGHNILSPLRYRIATNELEAKFCPAFMLSSIAIRRKAGIHEFADDFVGRDDVQRMMRLVETILDPEIEARGFDTIRSVIEVDLTDGRRFVQPSADAYRGGPDLPFSREQLHEKFVECGALLVSPAGLDRALETLEALEELGDVRQLTQDLVESIDTVSALSQSELAQ